MVLLVAVVLVAVVLVTVGQSVGVRVVEQRVVAVTPGEALHQKKKQRTTRFSQSRKDLAVQTRKKTTKHSSV